ncbi:MAG: DUF2384 domain-containing protein [Niabella sp.]
MQKGYKKYQVPEVPENIVSEPAAIYLTTPKIRAKEVQVKDFTYTNFKKIADISPFTLHEWANLLFISERTLQRYAKDNSTFNGLQIERILHLKKLVEAGNELFGQEGFKQWLSQKPFSLGGVAVKDMLVTHDGIQDVIDLMGRMQYGIPA